MSIEKSVNYVASAWKESPYYDDAEKWTYLFWDDATVFRKLFEMLDLDNVIELAVGHGRHSEKIAHRCGRLTLMDIHQENLDVCNRRLAQFSNVSALLNSGYDFQPAKSDSVSAIFCYDAMVHFSPDVVESYIKDASRVLKPGGRALYHHSNYDAPGSKYSTNPHSRNHMTQDIFRSYCDAAGMRVLESTVIRWGRVQDIDCVSLIERPAA